MGSETRHKYILIGKNNTLRFNVKTMIHQKENQDSVLTSIESLRLEIQSLKNEFRKMEGTILKDRLKSVENALSQNRLLYALSLIQDRSRTALQNKLANTLLVNIDDRTFQFH